ncbi:stAR-related lipid transfer protein 7, mitochondrial [Lampetra fluviatilis]
MLRAWLSARVASRHVRWRGEPKRCVCARAKLSSSGGGGSGWGSGSHSGSGWGWWGTGWSAGWCSVGWWSWLRTRSLGAMATVLFSWERNSVGDDEITRCVVDLQTVERLSALPGSDADNEGDDHMTLPGWELVTQRPGFTLWRRPLSTTHTQLYQYKVYGTYTDISPQQFLNVQLDIEYRKRWDQLVIRLDLIDHDESTGSEVIHWVTHFPYPLYARDYVYVRRHWLDEKNNIMVLVSRSVDHPDMPESSKFVRVRSYYSQMVVRAHSSFQERGFDYLLTYQDDPQTVFPRSCISWMVSSGMPDFLEKLHLAALKSQDHGVRVSDAATTPPHSEPSGHPNGSVYA